MKELCRKTVIGICDETTPVSTGKDSDVQTCQSFSVCLGFGRRLVFDGRCLSVVGESLIPDGVYGKVVIRDGCAVDALPPDVCEYTPAPCVPASADCNGGSSGGGSGSGGDVIVKTDICNLLQRDAAGRLGAYLSVEAGPGILVEGCGTEKSPLVISSSGGGGSGSAHIMSAEKSFLTVSGSGGLSDPFVLQPTEVIKPGKYCGIEVDRYGRVLGCDGSEGAIRSIIGQAGVEASVTGSVATVGLTLTGVDPGDYDFGHYTVTVDQTGRITKIVDAGSGNATTSDEKPNHAVKHWTNENDGIQSIDLTTSITGVIYVNWHGRLDYNSAVAVPFIGWLPGWMLPTADPLQVEISSTTSVDGMYEFDAGFIREYRCRSSAPLSPGSYQIKIHRPPLSDGTYPPLGRGVLEVRLVE